MTDARARIADYSDREIMAVMTDLQPNGGVVWAGEMVKRIFGLKETESNMEILDHAARCLTSRLAWMRRYGLVEKGEKPGEWTLSQMGRELRSTRLGQSFGGALDNTPEASLLEVAHRVGERMIGASPAAGRAMLRELAYQSTRRRKKERGW